jgi:hypothetical protein
MTNLQSIIGLFIVLVVILSMGLQFSFFKEGFNNNVSNKVKEYVFQNPNVVLKPKVTIGKEINQICQRRYPLFASPLDW